MTTKIEWSDPPAKARENPLLLPFVEAVRSRPGDWARYPGDVKSTSAAQNWRARFKDLEIVTRTVDGKINLWARVRPSA